MCNLLTGHSKELELEELELEELELEELEFEELDELLNKLYS